MTRSGNTVTGNDSAVAGPGEPRSQAALRATMVRYLPTAAVFVAALAALFWHSGGATAWHTLWAEDGRFFIDCAQNNSYPHCVTTSYAGYLHFAPRTISAIAVMFPVADWARAVTGMVLLVTAVAFSAIYATTAWLVPERLFRAALVGVVLISAALRSDIGGNMANLHWILLVSSLFVAVNPDASSAPLPAALRGIWLVVTCASEALAPVVPIALLVGALLKRRRDQRWYRSDLLIALPVLAVSVAQVVTQVRSPRPDPTAPSIGLGDALRLYRDWVGHYSWDGFTTTSTDFLHAVVIAGAVLLVGGVVLTLRRRAAGLGRALVVGVLLLLGSVAEFVLSVIVNHGVSIRYTLTPFVLVLFGAGTVLSALYRGTSARAALVPAASAVVLLAFLAAVGPYPPRAAGNVPGWRHQVASARQQCHARAPGTPDRVTVVIAPKTSAAPWVAAVPCRLL